MGLSNTVACIKNIKFIAFSGVIGYKIINFSNIITGYILDLTNNNYNITFNISIILMIFGIIFYNLFQDSKELEF
jgi:hypothetical protein